VNRGEIKQAVRDEMQLDPGLISDAERNRFINYWLDDVASWGLLEKSITLPVLAGNNPITLPNNLIHLAEVIYEGRDLVPTSMRVSGEGNPVAYALEGRQLHLLPLPSVAGEVRLLYSYRPEHLTSDVDIPEVPNDWMLLGVLYTVFRAHKKNGNTAASREYQQEYEMKKGEKVREMLQHYNSRVRVMSDSSQPLNWIDRLRL